MNKIELKVEQFPDRNDKIGLENGLKMVKFLTAFDVMEDLEKSLSFSRNFRFLLSVFDAFLFMDKYRSQPRMIFPYKCVSSKYEPSKA